MVVLSAPGPIVTAVLSSVEDSNHTHRVALVPLILVQREALRIGPRNDADGDRATNAHRIQRVHRCTVVGVVAPARWVHGVNTVELCGDGQGSAKSAGGQGIAAIMGLRFGAQGHLTDVFTTHRSGERPYGMGETVRACGSSAISAIAYVLPTGMFCAPIRT